MVEAGNTKRNEGYGCPSSYPMFQLLGLDTRTLTSNSHEEEMPFKDLLPGCIN